MKCPYCGSEETRVTDSRPVEESNLLMMASMTAC